MRTTISVPDQLHHAAVTTSRDLGVSPSEVYSRALQRFLEGRAAPAPPSPALDPLLREDIPARPLAPPVARPEPPAPVSRLAQIVRREDAW
jgi:hypothetical protein